MTVGPVDGDGRVVHMRPVNPRVVCVWLFVCLYVVVCGGCGAHDR